MIELSDAARAPPVDGPSMSPLNFVLPKDHDASHCGDCGSQRYTFHVEPNALVASSLYHDNDDDDDGGSACTLQRQRMVPAAASATRDPTTTTVEPPAEAPCCALLLQLEPLETDPSEWKRCPVRGPPASSAGRHRLLLGRLHCQESAAVAPRRWLRVVVKTVHPRVAMLRDAMPDATPDATEPAAPSPSPLPSLRPRLLSTADAALRHEAAAHDVVGRWYTASVCRCGGCAGEQGGCGAEYDGVAEETYRRVAGFIEATRLVPLLGTCRAPAVPGGSETSPCLVFPFVGDGPPTWSTFESTGGWPPTPLGRPFVDAVTCDDDDPFALSVAAPRGQDNVPGVAALSHAVAYLSAAIRMVGCLHEGCGVSHGDVASLDNTRWVYGERPGDATVYFCDLSEAVMFCSAMNGSTSALRLRDVGGALEAARCLMSRVQPSDSEALGRYANGGSDVDLFSLLQKVHDVLEARVKSQKR